MQKGGHRQPAVTTFLSFSCRIDCRYLTYQERTSANSFSKNCFGLAPMTVLFTSPRWKRYTAGIEVIPYCAAMAGLSSTFTLTTSTFSLYSPAISSRIGPSLRHGPHHSAQKSTITGLSAERTSVSKLASVTSFALLITFSFFSNYGGAN